MMFIYRVAFILGLFSATHSFASEKTLLDLTTKKTIAITEMNKKPMLYFFWASWCKNCSENLAAAQKLISPEILKDHVRGVSVDDDPKVAVTYFTKKPHLTFFKDHSLLDAGGAFAESIKLDGLPGIALVDDKGQVVKRWQGVLDSDQQKDLLKRLSAMVKK